MCSIAKTITVFTLVLAACDGNTPVATRTPGNVAVASTAQGVVAVAARQAFSGRCTAEPSGPPVVVPPILNQLNRGTCQLSQLGRSGLWTMQHVNVVTGAQTAEITYTASNGDLLYATNVGKTSKMTGPTTRRFTGTNTVTGGTGRFANATGQFNAEGTVDIVTGRASFSYDGWIAFGTSDSEGR